MSKPNLMPLTPLELLRTHAGVIEELRKRSIVRTVNNPLAGYTEWLVSTKLGLRLAGNSQAGFDATGPNGLRYEIKGRRITPKHPSTQLSVIRNLAKAQFDLLIGVIFDEQFSLLYAAEIPHKLISKLSKFNDHQKGHILFLRRTILKEPGVRDINTATQHLTKAGADRV